MSAKTGQSEGEQRKAHEFEPKSETNVRSKPSRPQRTSRLVVYSKRAQSRSTLDCRRRSTFAYHLDDLRGEAACDSWTPRAASLTGLAGLLKLTHDKHYLKTS